MNKTAEKNWKNEFIRLKKAVNKYLKVNRDMVDFMHEHLMDLADEQVVEYDQLCEAEGEAAGKLY